MKPVLLIALAALFALANGSACTDACDASFTGGNPLTFCSPLGVTYTTRQAALMPTNAVNSSCYARCGVGIEHVGACGCPNGCYSEYNQGVCGATSKVCECAAGYGGRDCSQIKCPSTCSGHGTCVSNPLAAGSGDYCKCDNGYTSNDCAIKIPDELVNTPYGTLPYGEIPTGGDYYKKDTYKDAHPVFNSSEIATVKLWLSPSNIQYILDPTTIWQQEYAPATIYFNNGRVSTYSACEFRVKGSSTRINAKKSWNIKFPKKQAFMDLKGFALKTPVTDRLVSSQLVIEFYRAMKSQTYKHSFAQLYLNDVFYGLQMLEERIDDNFMKSRWNEDSTNLYKFGPYDMQYLGPNQADYEQKTVTIYDGLPLNIASQEEGNGNWTDIIEYITAINGANRTYTNEYLTKYFGLDHYFRTVALETITLNADAYPGIGNNYQYVNTNKKGIFWEYFGFDFDIALGDRYSSFARVLGMTGAQLQALFESGQTVINGLDLTQYIFSPNPYVPIQRKNKPLLQAVFERPEANATYTAALKEFVKRVIVDSRDVTHRRRQAFVDLVRPLVAKDKMYAVATGSGLAQFDASSAWLKNALETRWGYLASMFYANGKGVCNASGVCVCNENYFGADCSNFCGVEVSQTKSGEWTSNGQPVTQWQATLLVGSRPVYSAELAVNAHGGSFSPSNLDKVQGSSNLYTIPQWQYTNGAIPAYSNSVTFGYTVTSSQAASFTLNNFACEPKACPGVQVTLEYTNSWESAPYTNQQVTIRVINNSPTAAANVNVALSFTNGAFVASSYNINPSTSTAQETSKTFTCSLWNLAPGGTRTDCGFVLAVPTSGVVAGGNAAITSSKAVCL